MKYIDEYRDRTQAVAYFSALRKMKHEPWRLLEVCGGQTHTLLKYNILDTLPHNITLVHGPGCPVCVTPLDLIDKAITLSCQENLVLCTFADLLRIPGSESDLQHFKADGRNIQAVLSPLDALHMARCHPDCEIVFLAAGYETTAPATAMAVHLAREQGIANFSILASHTLILPALESVLKNPETKIDGLLAPGHVCTVTGIRDYEILASTYNIPVVITGFEPIDLLQGIVRIVRQLEKQLATVEIQYSRAVRPDGNLLARQLVDEVFEITDREWRGIGTLEKSGLTLRAEFRDHDADIKFKLKSTTITSDGPCIMGAILQGLKKPLECPLFEVNCTPDTPQGAAMVSAEGVCAAYYHYKRRS